MRRYAFVLMSLFRLFSSVYAQELRDPWEWPYDKASIWNMPIHNDAVLEPANITSANSVAFDVIHLLKLNPDDPLRDVRGAGWTNRCASTTSQGYQLNIPDGWIVKDAGSSPYGNTPNSTFAFLKVDGTNLMQGQVIARCDGTGPVHFPTWVHPTRTDQNIYGDGLGAAGHGASQLTALGGTIRPGELLGDEPIRHALKITIWAKRYLHYSSSIKGWKWPAKSADQYASTTTYAGTNPNFVMGTLLAIPPSHDKASLNLETNAGRKIYDALKDYGAYIVEDAAWDCHYLSVDEDAISDVGGHYWSGTGSGFSRDINKIFAQLHIVTSNGPANIGGGPTDDWENRRAPMAPDFIARVDSVTGVNVSPTDLLLAVGASTQLMATIKPNYASNKEVSWSSSNESVATVDANGIVLAIAEGTATITATTQQNNLSAGCTVNVTLYGGHTPIPAKIEAEDYSDMKGVQTETTSDTGGGLHVSSIGKGDWMDYKIHVSETRDYAIVLRIASPYTGRQIEILVDGVTRSTLDVPNTGSWDTWGTASATINLRAGSKTLRILSSAGGGSNFYLNWLDIKHDDDTTGTSNAKVPHEAKVTVYPNPVNGNSFIIKTEGLSAPFDLRIFNLAGALVYASYQNNLNQLELPANTLGNAGIYTLEVNSLGRVYTLKLISE